jgi:hypothetical protein
MAPGNQQTAATDTSQFPAMDSLPIRHDAAMMRGRLCHPPLRRPGIIRASPDTPGVVSTAFADHIPPAAHPVRTDGRVAALAPAGPGESGHSSLKIRCKIAGLAWGGSASVARRFMMSR